MAALCFLLLIKNNSAFSLQSPKYIAAGEIHKEGLKMLNVSLMEPHQRLLDTFLKGSESVITDRCTCESGSEWVHHVGSER